MMPLELDRREVAKRGMPAPRIVPALYELEHAHLRLGLCAEATLGEQFALESREEALAHRVIVAIADTAHGRPDSGFPATQPKAEYSA
jgi:hypothetical protein